MIYYYMVDPREIAKNNFILDIQNIDSLDNFPWKDNINNRGEVEIKLKNKESISFIFRDSVVLLMNISKEELIEDTCVLLRNAENMIKDLLNNIEMNYNIKNEKIENKENI